MIPCADVHTHFNLYCLGLNSHLQGRGVGIMTWCLNAMQVYGWPIHVVSQMY